MTSRDDRPDNDTDGGVADLRSGHFWLGAQKEAFQAAMNDAPLETSLGVLVDAVVRHAGDGRRCAFYIADPQHNKLRHVVGMPASYAEAIEGFAISPESLACGLAVASGQPVVTADVLEEQRWQPWTWLAREYDYRGCWSFPVETSTGRVVGSFAFYFREPRSVTPADQELAAALTQTAGIIISRYEENMRLRAREADLARVQRIGGVGGVEIDVTGGMLGTRSPEYLRLHGLPPDLRHETHEQWLQRVHPDDRGQAERTLFAALAGTGDSYDSEYRIIRPADGDVRWIHARADIERDASGKAVRLVGAHLDVTEQKRAQEVLRESEERLRMALEAGLMGTWRFDLRTGRQQWSEQQFRLFGLEPAGEPPTRELFMSLVLPEDHGLVEFGPEDLLPGRGLLDAEFRIRRPDGEIRWLVSHTLVRRNAANEPLEMIGLNWDITGRKQAEQHQQLLLFELQHRVRNTLSVIRSIIRRTAETSSDKDDMLMHLDGRVDAFARVQAAVTRDPAKGLDLAMLVADELRVAGASEGPRLSIAGVTVWLAPRAAETIGLAIHELTTNAIKYGALASHQGRLAITWAIERDGAEPTLQLVWTERQVEGVITAPAHRGFGTEILTRTLPYELQATTDMQFRPDGLSCRIAVPLAQLVAGEGR